MTKRLHEKGVCPACGSDVAIRADGLSWTHRCVNGEKLSVEPIPGATSQKIVALGVACWAMGARTPDDLETTDD